MKLLGLLVLTCAMVATSGFVATIPGPFPRVVGLFGIAFFGLGFVLIPLRMGGLGPQVVIDARGIEDFRSRLGLIPWGEIRCAWIGAVHGSRFLCLDLHEPDPILNRLPPWQRALAKANRAMGFGDLTLSFAGLSPGIDEVGDHIMQRIAEPELP